ncbi:hypothetical protein LTR53_002285 [Teratosphaeriaceae sp. CCFEE 6253]|nr:hypothetical protein LTR53_002285 [Teratosphaeriaceae sp. CCFEE 6253]
MSQHATGNGTSELWVGYEACNRRYIDKQVLPGDAQAKLAGLRLWWNGASRPWKQKVALILFCQRPAVAIGMIEAPAFADNLLYPHETQYHSLLESALLTRGFANPGTLVDAADFFIRNPHFEVRPSGNRDIQRTRQVLFVHYRIDKKLLLFPVLLALISAAIVAAVATVLTESIATGAQVGGTVGGITAVVLAYMMWRMT